MSDLFLTAVTGSCCLKLFQLRVSGSSTQAQPHYVFLSTWNEFIAQPYPVTLPPFVSQGFESDRTAGKLGYVGKSTSCNILLSLAYTRIFMCRCHTASIINLNTRHIVSEAMGHDLSALEPNRTWHRPCRGLHYTSRALLCKITGTLVLSTSILKPRLKTWYLTPTINWSCNVQA